MHVIIICLVCAVMIRSVTAIFSHKAYLTYRTQSMKKINISTKKYPNTFTIVDEENYVNLNQWKWYSHARGYVYRDTQKNKKKTRIYMHRYIMKPQKGMEIDHINHNPLDNRKSNLRICEQRQNSINRRSIRGKSIYKGVYWHNQIKKWHSSIKGKNRKISLGCHETQEDAAKAYNCAARILHGEYAYLNKIKEIK